MVNSSSAGGCACLYLNAAFVDALLKPGGTMQGEGLGVCRFANGNAYEGSFHDSVLSGLGVYSFASGSSYAGQVRPASSQSLYFASCACARSQGLRPRQFYPTTVLNSYIPEY